MLASTNFQFGQKKFRMTIRMVNRLRGLWALASGHRAAHIHQCALRNSQWTVSIEPFALAMRTGQLAAASGQFAAGNVQVTGSRWQWASVTSHSLTVSARLAIGMLTLAVGNLHVFSMQMSLMC